MATHLPLPPVRPCLSLNNTTQMYITYMLVFNALNPKVHGGGCGAHLQAGFGPFDCAARGSSKAVLWTDLDMGVP